MQIKFMSIGIPAFYGNLTKINGNPTSLWQPNKKTVAIQLVMKRKLYPPPFQELYWTTAAGTPLMCGWSRSSTCT